MFHLQAIRPVPPKRYACKLKAQLAGTSVNDSGDCVLSLYSMIVAMCLHGSSLWIEKHVCARSRWEWQPRHRGWTRSVARQ